MSELADPEHTALDPWLVEPALAGPVTKPANAESAAVAAPVTDPLRATRRPEDLICLFNTLFSESENTRLVLGGSEPIYLPADQQCDYHRVIFAHGFFASALHEIAHWCIAGKQRRRQVDYGYWYAPDGRNRQQQAAFERVEVKPQALEWIFAKACHKRFRVSVDNLSGEQTDATAFKQAVYQQVCNYRQQGLPARADLLLQALCDFYQSHSAIAAGAFQLAELG